MVNNSGSAITSITLSGSGNGGGIFAFDGDGICTYVSCSYSDPTGYEGPTTSFTAVSSDGSTGTVNFAGGLAPGSNTYFSLEGSPSSISGGLVITPTSPITPTGPTTTPTGVPEPSTFVILAGALLGLAAMRARSRA